MSKVQSPKSIDGTARAAAEHSGDRKSVLRNALRSQADPGLSTLDLGLLKDFGALKDFGLLISDLRKSFLSPNGERIEVLRGVSFSAQPGETIAIVGASGAGKSTLLHLIGGIEAPDHGGIKLNDFAVDSASRAELARYRNREVGVVFQFHHLLPDLTAVENVCLPLLLRRHDRREAIRNAHEALERLGLSTRAAHRITDLSGGEQQRIAVCRAMITSPLLILADEPTGNLDSLSGGLIESELISYAAVRPAIVIVATHNQDLARRCDRVLTLQHGRIVEN